MKLLLLMDDHNYDPQLEEIRRIAVRGIISDSGKILFIETANGELKLPGGGQEGSEDDIQTLIREIKEETGYHTTADSIREFGEVVERRMSLYENKIWHQINRYYFCDITGVQESCSLSDAEKRLGFHPVWYTLDQAIEKNEKIIACEGFQPWNQREYKVLRLIREAIGSN